MSDQDASLPDAAAALSLRGRIAVVTGAASGIGYAAAETYAAAGATVILGDIDTARLETARDRIVARGGRADAMPCDIADRESIEALADRAAGHGRIDVWANVAGIAATGHVVDTDAATYRRVVDINLGGVYWGCAAAARRMIAAGGGSIINISSNAADQPIAGLSLYAMAKAGVNMLTRSLATEVGPHGVRVNAIAPGFIMTGMTAPGSIGAVERDAITARNAARSPLGIVGEAQDIGWAMLYLACDASRFVTGQILRVNGGVAMP